MANLIVISGPTASGKTSLSLHLAKHFNAEIISADARQFYRGMNIGTAKASTEEQSAVRHHFIDNLDPNENYSAGQFEDEVIKFLSSYFKESETAILVGGSGLYINAVTQGFDDLPRAREEIRTNWNEAFEAKGLAHLQERLKEVDPDYFAEVDLNNRMRLQRALESFDETGIPFSKQRKGKPKKRNFSIHHIAIVPPREELYDRINKRVDQMMSKGLESEVKGLLKWKNQNALQTVGYKEIFDYLSGEMSLEEAVLKIKQHSRNYAKRQYTWLRKQEQYGVFTSNDPEPVIRHLQEKMNV